MVEYFRLEKLDKFDWRCPACILSELPFADSSMCSNIHITELDVSVTSNLSQESTGPDLSTLKKYTTSPIFCHFNAQSLLPKIDEIRTNLSENTRPIILGISETWLDSSVLNGEVDISFFRLYRRDRGMRGGGVMIYVLESYRSRRRSDLEVSDIEIVWIELHFKKNVILLGNVYHPPNFGIESFSKISNMLEIALAEKKEVVLMGDMNCNLLTTTRSRRADELVLIAEDLHLTQLISEPTRITEHSQSLIDVLFTSNPDLFSSTGTVAFTGSDHLMVYGECSENVKSSPKVSFARSFKKCDTNALLSDLDGAPWHLIDMFDCLDDKWDYWRVLFLGIVDKHAPLLKMRTKKDTIEFEFYGAKLYNNLPESITSITCNHKFCAAVCKLP